jgi:hypothetical protein
MSLFINNLGIFCWRHESTKVTTMPAYFDRRSIAKLLKYGYCQLAVFDLTFPITDDRIDIVSFPKIVIP